MTTRTPILTIASLAIMFLLGTTHAQSDNGRGRHKQLYAVPTPGAVTIDGKLDDWDLSAQIEMFVVEATRASQSAKFAMMYDNEALYVGAVVNDPSPMMNRHDPKVDPNRAWDADACQFRLTIDPEVGYPIKETTFKYKGPKAETDTRTDIIHTILWYFTDDDSANLEMQTGMTYRTPNEAWGPLGLVPHDAFSAKYLKREDGAGYSFEYRIPWSTLGAKRPLKGGDIVAGTVQFNWSRPDGLKTAGGSAWAYDVMSGPGFAFQSTECWGKILFSETGNVSRDLVSAGVPPEKPLPLEFSYELPEDSETTIQLYDQDNKVVRLLVAQQQRLGGKNLERWDGLDREGKLLPAGDYTWKGVYHAPIKAEYRFSVHNSGQPPYPTDNNRGGWGGDHGTPQTAVALPDGMILAWNGCEFGWGIIRTDLNGKKLWGSKHDATYMATDGKLLFIAGGHGFNTSPEVQILAVTDSRPSRFANGVATLPAPDGDTPEQNEVTGLAYANGTIYVSYGHRNLIGCFSGKTGELEATLDVPAAGRLAARPDGSLAVISGKQIVAVAAGKVTPWLTTHLDEPQGITIAADGTTYVTNRGQLQNVSVFGADGTYLRSLGKTGGRPAKGRYDASGMYMAGGLVLAADGKLWVAETTDGPKRFSVWDTTSGDNLLEFFGGSCYFAYGAIDPARPNEIYGHDVLWQIDWAANQATPFTTIWRQTSPDMMPPPGPDAYQNHPRLTTAANGHQYMWGAANKSLSILLRRDGDVFRPFAAFMRVGDRDANRYFKTTIRSVDDDPASFPTGMYFWQDANDDQLVTANECTRLGKGLERAGIEAVARDLTIRLSTQHLLHPAQMESTGKPVYDIAQAEATPVKGGRYLQQDADGSVYTFDPGRDPALVAWAPDGTVRWSYGKIIGWHEALNLPIVKPGRLWGMTGAMGIGGDYFAHQTYFGINHLFRKDGLYIAALLKDGRTGGRGPFEGQPEGQNGSFVKLTIDGQQRYFLIGGGQDVRVWEVLGLDAVKDLPGGTYHHTPEMVAQAEQAQAEYAAALGGAKKLLIARGRKALEVAGAVGKTLEDGRGFTVKAAYDADNLYLQYDITTPNPLINGMSEPNVVFRGGNLLDLQLGTAAATKRDELAPGDVRLLVTRHGKDTMAVLFRPKVAGFTGQPTVLTSPTGNESFDSIEVVSDQLDLLYRPSKTGFTATLTIPQKLLGLQLKPGEELRYDLGYIFGNKDGTRTAVRAYVHNNSFTANVVDDIPHESRLEPAEWGTATVE